MRKRLLGNSLEVSAIGYGAMGLSEFYGETNDNKALEVLQTIVDADIDFIDTANLYGRGHNERLIGHFLARMKSHQRKKIKVATKCGIQRADNENYNRRINNSPEYIKACCHESLQQLGIERIDLYYLHRVDPQSDIEESMASLRDLVQEGKIAHVGLCEVSAATLEKAHRFYPVTALQTEYSLWTRDIEADILPMAIKHGIGVVPYSPLGRGFLAGKYLTNQIFSENDFRKHNARFSEDNLNHNARMLAAVQPLANKYHCTLGQIALSWLQSQYEKIIPIPGTKNSQYALENAMASEIVLQPDDVTLLNNLKNIFEVKGARYSAEGMKGINA